MSGYWTDKFSYVTGSLRNRELACVAVAADERLAHKEEHSTFLQWKTGKWGRLLEKSVSWNTVDATVCRHPSEQTIFLGLRGEAFCVGGGDAHVERIREGQPDSPENRGMMRGIKAVEGKAFAVGMQRQAYRRDGVNNWTCIDATARPDPKDETVYSFEGIDGFAQKELYAAGRRGEIWMYNGKTWKQQDSPTNMILTRVCCAEDGNVYICGRLGTVIRGSSDRWELVKQTETKDDFWGAVWFRGSLYLSTMRGVFRLDGDALEPIKFGKDKPSSCYTLTVTEDAMWSIGAKDVMAFDGKSWSRID